MNRALLSLFLPFTSMVKKTLSLFLLIFVNIPLLSASTFPIDRVDSLPPLESYDGQFEIADEIEIGEKTLINLVEAFDFSGLQKRIFSINETGQWYLSAIGKKEFQIPLANFDSKIKEIKNRRHLLGYQVVINIAHDYLIQPKAFSNLDPKFKEKLTEGLNLDKNLILTKPSGEIDLSTSFRDAKNINVFDDYQNKVKNEYNMRDGILVDEAQLKKDQWASLHNRWNNLPIEEQLKHMNFEYLSRRKKSQLLINYPQMANLKHDASIALMKVLGNKIWGFESNAIFEFKAHPEYHFSSARKYVDHILNTAQITLNSSSIESPGENPDGDMSTHLNISKARGAAISLKLQTALSHLYLSHTFDFYPKQIPRLLNYKDNPVYYAPIRNKNFENSYSLDLMSTVNKGLIAFEVSTKRLEIRYHYLPPEQELKLLLYYLSMEEADALKKIYTEVASRISKDRLTTIIKKSGYIGVSLYLDLLENNQASMLPPIDEILLMLDEYIPKKYVTLSDYDYVNKNILYKMLTSLEPKRVLKFLKKSENKTEYIAYIIRQVKDNIKNIFAIKTRKHFVQIISTLKNIELTVDEQIKILTTLSFSTTLEHEPIKDGYYLYIEKYLKLDTIAMAEKILSNIQNPNQTKFEYSLNRSTLVNLASDPKVAIHLYDNYLNGKMDYTVRIAVLSRNDDVFDRYLDNYLRTGNKTLKNILTPYLELSKKFYRSKHFIRMVKAKSHSKIKYLKALFTNTKATNKGNWSNLNSPATCVEALK